MIIRDPASEHLRTFGGRNEQHQVAMSAVRDIIEDQGLLNFESGIETEERRHWELLSQQYDALSIMLRFRPDQTAILPGVSALLFEIKSEALGRDNFAIEDLSYLAAREWHTPERKVVYALVDLCNGSVKMCWFDDMPMSQTLFVPARFDFEEQWARVRQMWPSAYLIPTEHKNGSGTPYFLVRKKSRFLKTATSFFTDMNKLEQPTLF